MTSSGKAPTRASPFGIALGITTFLWTAPAAAFPPYRSTDAETAEVGELEVRLGLGRLEREGADNEYAAPLARVNLGLRPNLELVSEFEHPTQDEASDEAAFGFKWVSGPGMLRFGIETLALPPMSASHAGMGVESQLIATLRTGSFRIHANAGGFYDSRPSEDERGRRGSLLVERQVGPARYGIEIFARKAHSEEVRAQLGPGVILKVGSFDIRAGLHMGLTSETPDMAVSVWISRAWTVWEPTRSRVLAK